MRINSDSTGKKGEQILTLLVRKESKKELYNPSLYLIATQSIRQLHAHLLSDLYNIAVTKQHWFFLFRIQSLRV